MPPHRGVRCYGFLKKSIRAGFVTQAATTGMPTWAIKRHTRHATYSALDPYLQPGEHVFASA